VHTAHGEPAAGRGGALVRGEHSVGAGGAEEGDAAEVAAHAGVGVERLGQRDVQQRARVGVQVAEDADHDQLLPVRRIGLAGLAVSRDRADDHTVEPGDGGGHADRVLCGWWLPPGLSCEVGGGAVARSVSRKLVRPSSANASVDLMACGSVIGGVLLTRHRTCNSAGGGVCGSLQDRDDSGPGPRRFLTLTR
jgi:hypothetical protein